MSGTSPCRVLDMSWTCPLSWVFRSNLEYPPSPGYRSGSKAHDTGIDMLFNCSRSLGRYMDHVWHTWQTMWIWGPASPQTSPQTWSYITPSFRPKCQVGIYAISWAMGCGPGRMIQQVGICYPNAVWVFDGVYAMFDRYGESKGA